MWCGPGRGALQLHGAVVAELPELLKRCPFAKQSKAKQSRLQRSQQPLKCPVFRTVRRSELQTLGRGKGSLRTQKSPACRKEQEELELEHVEHITTISITSITSVTSYSLKHAESF